MANSPQFLAEDDGRVGKIVEERYAHYKGNFALSPSQSQRSRRVSHGMDLAKAELPPNSGRAKSAAGAGPSQLTMGAYGSGRPDLMHRRESKEDIYPLLFGFQFTEVRALLLLNVIAMLYGTNTTIMKDILNSTHHRASTATVARSFTAAMAVIPLILMDKKSVSIALWRAGLDVGFWLAFGCFSQSNSLQTVTSSEASVMLALTIVVVSVLELLIGRKPTTRRILPVIVALSGLTLMELGNDRGEDFNREGGLLAQLSEGTVWGVASAVGFGVHLFRSDVVQDSLSEAESIKLGGLQLVTCAGYHVVWVIWDMFSSRMQGNSMPLDIQELPWLEILFCGVVSTGLAQFLELVCVKHAKASSTAIVFAQVPVWGLILGFVVHGDRMSFLSLIGSGMVVLAATIPYFLNLMGFSPNADTHLHRMKRKNSDMIFDRRQMRASPSLLHGTGPGVHQRRDPTDVL